MIFLFMMVENETLAIPTVLFNLKNDSKNDLTEEHKIKISFDNGSVLNVDAILQAIKGRSVYFMFILTANEVKDELIRQMKQNKYMSLSFERNGKKGMIYVSLVGFSEALNRSLTNSKK